LDYNHTSSLGNEQSSQYTTLSSISHGKFTKVLSPLAQLFLRPN
jgi:hypothetical protein